ncbi:MAG: DNA gyrase C-terminal beta-propeller domain-containing protein, partial [Halanaerobiales bacterium]
NGNIAGIKVVNEEDELIIISSEGILIRTEVNQISCISRNTQGVKVMALEEGDRVVALARIVPEDEDEDEIEGIEEIDGVDEVEEIEGTEDN